MTGYLAPFDPAVFDAQSRLDNENISYTAGINFFWQNSISSITPYVPLYRSRVEELAAELFANPEVLRWPLVVAINFDKGSALPRGLFLKQNRI